MAQCDQSPDTAGSSLIELSTLDKYEDCAISKHDVGDYRACIADAHAALERQFNEATNARDLVRLRADFVDTIITHLWRRSDLSDSEHILAAVGGYGRRELHPFSDVDIASVLGGKLTQRHRKALEVLVTFLWDIGLEVGHSVRSVKECVQAAADDITIMTNLMEARLICGRADLFAELRSRTTGKRIWPPAKFFAAKNKEQIQRHAKYNDAFQELEPNIKESPGGLRDIQVIAWVANRHFKAAGLTGLVDNGFLTPEEGAALLAGEEFLWQIRCALHFRANRREDRLLFDHQKSVAITLGYNDDGPNRAVECFMKDYYRTVRELSSLNEMLLGLFREAILESDRRARIAPLNRRFQIRNDAIEISNPQVFSRSPTALMEIFLLLQQHPDIKGIRATTIRELRRNLHLIDDNFRADLRARSLFMEIIRQPRRIGHELQRMHRYGILSAYLPAFAAVEGLMQFDLFHIYTVDEHTLFVVRNMRYFSFPRSADDQPALILEIVENIPKLELLYIAGLFHDIAKGRGGNHSDLGAEDAVNFCRTHGLSVLDTHLVAWLVRNHLIMSSTAQRKDIYDIEVVREFAKLVGDQIHLDYLFLLTVADIRGTNPALWTSWKESLLSELYIATRRMLRRAGGAPLDKDERIRATRRSVRKLLAGRAFPEHEINMLWDSLSDNYFLRHRPEEIAWHTDEILSTDLDDLPVVSVRSFNERGGSAVFVYEKDIDNLFALTTAALDKLRLDIQDARIITSHAGYTLDTYMVIEADSGEPIRGPTRIQEVCSKIRSAIRSREIAQPSMTHAASRKLKHFNIPIKVEFDIDKVHNCTVMEVTATDQPGLLSKIGRAMQQCDVRLHDARIATFGERVEDYFYITDHSNKALDSRTQSPRLKAAVIDALTN